MSQINEQTEIQSLKQTGSDHYKTPRSIQAANKNSGVHICVHLFEKTMFTIAL